MPACAGMTGGGTSDALVAQGDLARFWIASSARLRGPPRNDTVGGFLLNAETLKERRGWPLSLA